MDTPEEYTIMMQNDLPHNISPADFREVSDLATSISDQLLDRLDLVALKPKKILDLSSRTGHTVKALQARYPEALVMGLDISPSMLQYAKQNGSQAHAVCASATRLPVPPGSIDLIVANLLLPWCGPVEHVFTEWRDALRPEGLLIFTSYGPDTLREVPRDALRPLQLMDMHDLGDCLLKMGFEGPVLDRDHFILRYRDLKKLSREAYMMGFTQSEHLSLEGAGPYWQLGHEIIFGQAWSPLSNNRSPNVQTFPLEQLRRQLRGP